MLLVSSKSYHTYYKQLRSRKGPWPQGAYNVVGETNKKTSNNIILWLSTQEHGAGRRPMVGRQGKLHIQHGQSDMVNVGERTVGVE